SSDAGVERVLRVAASGRVGQRRQPQAGGRVMSGGRPKGALSWFNNPANIAALEMQRQVTLWIDKNAVRAVVRPEVRRCYVPEREKPELAKRAIEQVTWWGDHGFWLLGWRPGTKLPTVEQVLQAYRRLGRASSVRLKKVTAASFM